LIKLLGTARKEQLVCCERLFESGTHIPWWRPEPLPRSEARRSETRFGQRCRALLSFEVVNKDAAAKVGGVASPGLRAFRHAAVARLSQQAAHVPAQRTGGATMLSTRWWHTAGCCCGWRGL
jgi:hypothetical protein